MIKRFSTLLAIVASIIVFAEGLWFNVDFQTLAIRILIAFFAFYILGNFLGVITIEALLENQLQKKEHYKKQQEEKSGRSDKKSSKQENAKMEAAN